LKAHFEGMRPGEPMIVDDFGRRISLTLRLIPETPDEVAELRKFCRMTDAFSFVIDEEFRDNTAHIAPVYAERSFSVVQKHIYVEDMR
jgi:hypothetical protein